MTLRIDLGCGIEKQPGCIGVDMVELPSVDVVADIRKPLPFRANSVDAVYLNDVIEHIPDTIKLMEEIWHVCKHDARVFVRVVNWDSQYMAIDPTHVRPIHAETFSFFGHRPGREYYTNAKFEVVRIDKGWDDTMRRLVLGSRRALEFLAHYLHNVLIDLNIELKVVKPILRGNYQIPGF